MGRNISIENGAGDFTEVSSQVLVVPTVRDGNAGYHVNEQFMDNQPVLSKCDKFTHRQTTVVAEFMRLRNARRNVLTPKYCRERQILSRQFGFQAWVPSPIFGRLKFIGHGSRACVGWRHDCRYKINRLKSVFFARSPICSVT